MTFLTDVFALFSLAVASCAGVLGLYQLARPPSAKGGANGWAKAGILALFLVLLVPIPGAGIPMAGYFRGFVGDLSITIFALSVWSLCHRLFGMKALGKRDLAALLLVVGAASLLLYTTALGWGDWDAYRLGWGSWWFLSALLALSGISAWSSLRVLPALIALALLAWSAGLMESGNLWDYLLDPWLSAFALVFIFIKCSQSLFKRFANRSKNRSSH